MTDLKINIAHLPDRERPVAEVWAGDVQFAEVSCEAGDLCIEIYPNPAGGLWRFSFDEAAKAFEQAKERLAAVTGAVLR